MDKKGYIRTLEAVIAIVIVLSFVYAVMPSKIINPSDIPYVVESAQDFIIGEIEENPSIRTEITIYSLAVLDMEQIKDNTQTTQTDTLIKNYIPMGYSYDALICKQTSCYSDQIPMDAQAYVSDVLLSTGANDAPSIVRIWIWPD